jgi:endonuclease-3
MGREAVRERAGKILQRLLKAYGAESWNWHTRQSPFGVLIGIVLSQRTRDENTDKAAKALLSKYPSPEALAEAPIEEIEKLIEPTMYFRTKAPRIKEISRILLEKYGGKTPDNIDELLELPGVGMKTASCVLVYGFNKPAMPVDTHVHRISNRLGIIQTKTPEESERALWNVIPEEYLLKVNMLMVKHGQSTCKPAVPLCYKCPVIELCDYEPKTLRTGSPKKRGKLKE